MAIRVLWPELWGQYCSNEYQVIHQKHGLICSVTDGDDCYQNALVERAIGILKHEFLLQQPDDLRHAQRMVSQSAALRCRPILG